MTERCVLLKYGEMALKRGNREWFERHLEGNLRQAVTGGTSGSGVRMRWREGVVAVSATGWSQTQLTERLRELIGISVVQPALRAAKSPDAADAAALELLSEHPRAAEAPTFAVRARRRDKSFTLTSDQLAARIGERVHDDLGWPVDLGDPVVELVVEVDRNEVFLSIERHRGQGGLPVGAGGQALVLLSGGYDSPVAAYRAMRRGLRCDFVHFSGVPYTAPASIYKAYAAARELSRFSPGSRLFSVPVGSAQKTLATSGAGEAQIVAHRRLYLRAASALARQQGLEALVTGDSLGQVSSQTLTNLTTSEQACEVPLLRPLLAWDKDEIMSEARRIGTAEIAELSGEDCCQLFAPPRAATRTRQDRLARVERRAGLDDLVDEVLAHQQAFELDHPTAAVPA